MKTRIFIGLLILAALVPTVAACAVWLGFGFTLAVIGYAADHIGMTAVGVAIGITPTVLAVLFAMTLWRLHEITRIR